jgi:hypothetical protein
MALLVVCGVGLEAYASVGDYGHDAGPALDALAAGNLHRFLVEQPLMGLVSVVVRLPFVLVAKLAGAGELVRYRAGALPCLAATAALGIGLIRLRGLRPRTALLVPALAMVTPASLLALRWGHPEELLGGVLCVAAVLLADRRALWAGVALGLAIATKQWAILAVAPVLLAAHPGRRLRLLAAAIGVAELFTVPLFAANPSAFTHTTSEAAASAAYTNPESLWFLVSHPYHFVQGPASYTFYVIPSTVEHLSHPLIVLLPAILALVVWRRRCDPLALLALVLLARCVLDPVDNEYYHAPFLLALLAYETMARRRLPQIPFLTLFSAAGLWLTFSVLQGHGASPALTNAVYLAWTGAVALRLLPAAGLFPRVAWRERFRSAPASAYGR